MVLNLIEVECSRLVLCELRVWNIRLFGRVAFGGGERLRVVPFRWNGGGGLSRWGCRFFVDILFLT